MYLSDFTHVCCVHRFILLDLGEVGRRSDGGVFSNSAFGMALENGSLSIPGQNCHML